MTKRPQNIRPARNAERTHNSRRLHHVAESRTDEPQSGKRAYRGSHRAETQHRDTERGSRMGRHHTDH